ncbi:SDR family oxidoreductase [Mesorhizobium sp. M0025]|uniref:SDR family NAD(P)-dependent oxidoreductase n=1 Tax=unclassified Mesorhizobium TaxID=325217 RepID=UPI00333AE7DA
MNTSVKGIALVTGASSGIGAIYADRLARRGYDLILVARNQKKLDGVARHISGVTGRAVRTVAADLNDKADRGRIEALLRGGSGISMLVNNAGLGAVSSILETDVDAMDDMIELNVTAVTRLTYAAAPAFVARGAGSIINISSAMGLWPELLNGVYGATKAYVTAFTLSLHKELADKNIAVQAVLPGAVQTNFWDVAGGDLSNYPDERVMQAEDLVDAALAGFDQGELVTIPSLPDRSDWDSYEAARQKLIPNLSRKVPASRYRAAVDA